MKRLPIFVLALVALCLLPGFIGLRVVSGGGPTGASQTIASINLSGTTYVPNTANGVVGTLSVTMSPVTPASTAALTITGANSGGFHLSGAGCANISSGTCTLEQNSGGTTGAGPYTDVNIIATQASASNSPQSISPTLTGGGGYSPTMTFTNVGSSTTPTGATSDVPQQVMLNLPPGKAPPGTIYVPSIGGTPLTYGVDCSQEGCPAWSDGSLKHVPFSLFMPQFTAGQQQQVKWTAQSGSYSATSSVLPSTIAAASDYKVVLAGVNNTWTAILNQFGTEIGFNVSSGAATTSVVRAAPPPGTNGAYGQGCQFSPNCITASNYSAVTTGATIAGSNTTINFTAAPAAISIGNRAIVLDLTNPSAIPGDQLISSSTSTSITIATGATSISSGDTIAVVYAINGCSGAGFIVTLDGAGKLITGATLVAGGSGCQTIGSGRHDLRRELLARPLWLGRRAPLRCGDRRREIHRIDVRHEPDGEPRHQRLYRRWADRYRLDRQPGAGGQRFGNVLGAIGDPDQWADDGQRARMRLQLQPGQESL